MFGSTAVLGVVIIVRAVSIISPYEYGIPISFAIWAGRVGMLTAPPVGE